MQNIFTSVVYASSEEVSETTAAHADTWMGAILLNMGFQIINLVIFFFIFKFMFGGKISKSLKERKELIWKLKNADQEYENLIAKAQEEKTAIIDEALEHKKSIVTEAKTLAEKEKAKILDSATKKADDIVSSAQMQSNEMQKTLESNFEKWVKETVKVIVKKIINENAALQDQYLDNLVKNVKK